MSLALFKMLAPSPPSLPAVPSLAELQKHAEVLTSSLPSYSQYASSPTPTPSGEVIKSKPIPKVNLHPSGTGIAPTDKVEEDKTWLSALGLGSWVGPPPSYKAHDPVALTHKQLREEMQADRRLSGGTGGDEEVDQGREGLRKMQRGLTWGGKREVQAGIPGEEGVGGGKAGKLVKKDRPGREVGSNNQPMIGEMVGKDFSSTPPQQKNGWISWVRCGA